MNKEEIKEIFREKGALQEGHFELSSGYHSDKYVQCARVLQYPDSAQKLAQELVKSAAESIDIEEIDVVVGPAVGGIILAYSVALEMGVRAVFSERKHDDMEFRRGQKPFSGEKALVVDDVMTTGGSLQELVDLVAVHGAETVGLAVLVDRSEEKKLKIARDIPLASVFQLDLEVYSPEKCPMCSRNQSLDKPGSKTMK